MKIDPIELSFFLANMHYMKLTRFAKFFRFSTDGYLKYALLNITEPGYLSLSCQNLKVLLNLMSRLSRGCSFRPNMIYIKKNINASCLFDKSVCIRISWFGNMRYAKVRKNHLVEDGMGLARKQTDSESIRLPIISGESTCVKEVALAPTEFLNSL